MTSSNSFGRSALSFVAALVFSGMALIATLPVVPVA